MMLGIDLGAARARKLAVGMGAPTSTITGVSNVQLTMDNVGKSLVGLSQRIKDGDKVFIHYSGHGGQLPKP